MRESALLMRRYEEGLAAYTYLADDDAVLGSGDAFGTAAANGFTLPTPAPVDPASVAPATLHDSPVPPA